MSVHPRMRRRGIPQRGWAVILDIATPDQPVKSCARLTRQLGCKRVEQEWRHVGQRTRRGSSRDGDQGFARICPALTSAFRTAAMLGMPPTFATAM